MLSFTKTTLDNGLKVIIHKDDSTPMIVINLLYNVGSRDENPERTGMAHLLEHIMFGGSLNINSYDREIQKAGGENNAFTSNDITNYYIQLPAVNLETGLWLESDRMIDLKFTQKIFDTQKNVVIEEYKQRYLNQPYGDTWLLLRPLAYKIHPYRWPTIGSEIAHIENITLDELKEFYYKYYCPSNAILSISGNVAEKKCIELIDKWFGQIEKRTMICRNLPCEPVQINKRVMKVKRDVPYHDISMAFHMCSRKVPEYCTTDIISDILAGGKSSRFYRHLVMEKKLFSNIDAYTSGDIDPGLFVIRGKLIKEVEMDRAYNEILMEIDDFISKKPEEGELNKVKNKLESVRQYSHTDILNKAMDLAYYELLGNAEALNDEIDKYMKVTPSEVQNTAKSLFVPHNSSTLFYNSTQK